MPLKLLFSSFVTSFGVGIMLLPEGIVFFRKNKSLTFFYTHVQFSCDMEIDVSL